MTERILRRHDYIEDLCEFSAARFAEADSDINVFYQRLSASEREIILTELERASGPDPKSLRYFLENYAVINTADEDQPPRLQTVYPFRESQEILWEDYIYCWENKTPTWWILLKARQVGWSTLVQLMIFSRTIFNKHTKSLVIADERVRSDHIFDMSQLAYNNLPCWMRPEKQYDNKGKGEVVFNRKDDKLRLSNPGQDSAFYVDAANKPTGSSRGFTLHNLHATEISLYNNPKVLTSDIIPTLTKRNPLTIAVLEGTAEGRGYFYHRLWQKACEGKIRFRPVFTAWWKEKSYSMPFKTAAEKDAFELDEDERDLVRKVEEQYNRTLTKEEMHWRRVTGEEFAATEGDFDKVEQEYPSYPEAAFRAQGLTAFPKKKLQQIERRTVRPPLWAGEIVFDKGPDGNEQAKFITYWRHGDPGNKYEEAPLWIWEWPDPNEVFYGAADGAMGIPGDDYSTSAYWVVPRQAPAPYRQAAELKGYFAPKEHAKLTSFLGHFYGTCELSPENKPSELLTFIHQVFKYPKVYRWRWDDKLINRWSNYFGWETNQSSRPNLFIRFRTLMCEDRLVIRSSRLLDECYTCADADGSGKFKAAGDNHDDVLFANMICVYCAVNLDPSVMEREPVKEVDRRRDFYNTDSDGDEENRPTEAPDFSCL